ncbi:MAG: hypothetical protein OEZ02_10650 [Anaerolineae bacterium]|nr:hypothetical protein [Anaerolineae bacterium]
MKTKYHVTSLAVFALFCLLLLAGCSQLPAPVIDPTNPAAATNSSASTTVPSPTLKLAATLTPIPSPTLHPGEKMAIVLDLLQNNAGCKLPCWWGITPGITLWEDARRVLEEIVFKIVEKGSQEKFVSYVEIDFPEPLHVDDPRHIYDVIDGTIVFIQIMDVGDVLTYNLSAVLTDYGPPGSIWLKTWPREYMEELPFTIVLFYPHLGIMVYYGIEAEEVDGQIQACFHDDSAGPMALWSPERQMDFQEAINDTISFREYGEPYQSLEESTDMTVNDFYEAFKNSETESCLETPSSFWPEP